MPFVISKLDRAREVLMEESKTKCNPTIEIAFEKKDNITKNIIKHRRASQHFDLAAKISSTKNDRNLI